MTAKAGRLGKRSASPGWLTALPCMLTLVGPGIVMVVLLVEAKSVLPVALLVVLLIVNAMLAGGFTVIGNRLSRQCFCDTHAEDEEWHPCMLTPDDEGGKA